MSRNVNVHVDASKHCGSQDHLWRWIGYDAVSYTHLMFAFSFRPVVGVDFPEGAIQILLRKLSISFVGDQMCIRDRSRGYEALLHPYVDSKGNFGKFYSRDMAYAASRYTEAKLDSICRELFRDIDKDTVDFVDNYDNTMKEPALLPATFPTVLVNANTGIAVGMASNICPFNLGEVCQTRCV